MRLSRILIVVGWLTLLLGCGAMVRDADSLNSANAKGGMVKQKDVVYIQRKGVDKKRTSLDIYHHEDTNQLRPIIVYIHGGGWGIGDKSNAMRFKPGWAIRNGWILVSINYRLSPDVMHPEHARDAAAAVAWVFEHAEEFGGDAKQIAVMGHSAGAHLAAIVACDETLLGEYGMTTDQVAAVVLLDGAGYNLPDRMGSLPARGGATRMFKAAFGDDPELWIAASPTLQALPGDQLAPLFAIHADGRKIAQSQTVGLVKAWAATGARAEIHHAPNKTHSTLNRRFGIRTDKETMRVEVFLESVFD
ncbi:MAG: alpha/beta hydrolase [Phycisphaerales bacterium]|nr:alpha/beta hydrolase [Phycisphaerales bacterium]